MSASSLALAALAFGVGAAYWPGLYDFAEAPRWWAAAAGTAVCLAALPRPLDRGCGFVVLLLIWAGVSLLWSPSLDDGWQGLIQLAILGAAFIAGAQADSLAPAYRGFALALAASALLAIVQHYDDVTLIDQVVAPAGLFGNRDLMGEASVLALIGIVGFGGYGLAFYVGIALLLSGSRGGWMALIVVAVAWLRPRWPRTALLTAVLGAQALVAAFLLGNAHSLAARLLIWRDSIDGLSLLGQGIGSYYVAMPHYGHRLAQIGIATWHAHNDLLELWFELGVVGVVLTALIARSAWRPPGHEREKLILLAFAVEALVGFPLHAPATAVIAALVAGHLCGAGARLGTAVAPGGTGGRQPLVRGPLDRRGEPYGSAPRSAAVPA